MKRYKICCIYIVSLAWLAIVCFYLYMLFGKMIYMNVEYPTYTQAKDMIAQDLHAQVVMIGNSRGKAGFIPAQDLPYTSLNLSLGGASPIVGFYTLKKYLRVNPPPKVVILSYNANWFLYAGEFWERAIKFGFLDSSEVAEVIANAKALHQCKTLETRGGSCHHLAYYTYILDIRNFNAEIYNANGLRRYKANLKALKELQKSNGHFFYGKNPSESGDFAESSLNGFVINPLVELYLQKIATLAKQYNIKLVFYQMPYNQSTKLNPQFEAQYLAFLESLPHTYNIALLNLPYRLPNTAFGDDSHLYNGAQSVTKDIYTKLEPFLR